MPIISDQVGNCETLTAIAPATATATATASATVTFLKMWKIHENVLNLKKNWIQILLLQVSLSHFCKQGYFTFTSKNILLLQVRLFDVENGDCANPHYLTPAQKAPSFPIILFLSNILLLGKNILLLMFFCLSSLEKNKRRQK